MSRTGEEVWDLVDKIMFMTADDRENLFGDSNFSYIHDHYSIEEVFQMMADWEKSDFSLNEVVKIKDTDKYGVIASHHYFSDPRLYSVLIIDEDGVIIKAFYEKDLIKTGKYLEENDGYISIKETPKIRYGQPIITPTYW